MQLIVLHIPGRLRFASITCPLRSLDLRPVAPCASQGITSATRPLPRIALQLSRCSWLMSFVSQVVIGQSGIAHDSALRSRLQVLVAVDRHNRPPLGRGVAIDVVAAVYARRVQPRSPARGTSACRRLFSLGSPAASRASASSWATASRSSPASRKLARTSSGCAPSRHLGSRDGGGRSCPMSGSGRTIAVRLTATSRSAALPNFEEVIVGFLCSTNWICSRSVLDRQRRPGLSVHAFRR